MMPAATVSLVIPSITSNVYAMYILSNHYLFLLLLFLVCFTVYLSAAFIYLSAAFIEWFDVYILQSCLFLPETNFSISLLRQ